MKVLVVGNGGREHTLAWKIGQSPLVTDVYGTRPNAGMAKVCLSLDVSPTDVPAVVAAALEVAIGLAIIGPEAPLVEGLADALRKAGVAVVGPGAAAAELEGSKAFAKEMMARVGVPTAAYGTFDTLEPALAYLEENSHPLVVKASGLAAGKGVVICESLAESQDAVRSMLSGNRFGEAGAQVVIEEFLVGEEASLIALCSGTQVLPLASSQDHKRLGDHDEGPNTGGMGAYSPAPVLDSDKLQKAVEDTMLPILSALEEDGASFNGFLYAGLMMTANGPKVLEYNVRLGDPETQAILPRLKGDLVPVLLAVARGEDLSQITLDWDPRPNVCVVAASEGYPVSAKTGRVISGLETEMTDTQVFHAGTRQEGNTVVTSGGRVLGVSASGDTYREAAQRAYARLDALHFDGLQCRRDIAFRALQREPGQV